jgi:hypothetical protein
VKVPACGLTSPKKEKELESTILSMIHDFFHNSISHTMSSAHNYRVTKPTQRTPTCDMCRSRHQKCGGEQPQCSNCKLRAINCSYSSSKTRVPETKRSPETTFALPFVPSILLLANLKDPTNRPHRPSRPSISDADYDRLYSEIFGDIVCYIPPSPNMHHP